MICVEVEKTMKEKPSRHLRVETENLAVPEIRVSEGQEEGASGNQRTARNRKLRVEYDNLAVPEVRVDNEEES